MLLLAFAFSDAAEDVVADTARLEGASGLEVLEFEEDSASTI
jgi:hypothetical protein